MIHASKEITVAKYKRYWAVYLDTRLLVVAVYKRGAVAVKQLLEALFAGVGGNQSTAASITQAATQTAIAGAIDKAAKHFTQHGSLPSLTVMQNPCSGKAKFTSHPDCEDGMYRFTFHVGPSRSDPQ